MSVPQNRRPFVTLRTCNPFSPHWQKGFGHLNAKLSSSLLLSNLLEALPTNMYLPDISGISQGYRSDKMSDRFASVYSKGPVNRTTAPERNSSLDSPSVRKHYLFSSEFLK